MKGILNKLTPEKFDILSKQLIQLVTNKEVLHTTITMLFETAVAQPAFVTVYTDLASNLSQVRSLVFYEATSIHLSPTTSAHNNIANQERKLSLWPPVWPKSPPPSYIIHLLSITNFLRISAWPDLELKLLQALPESLTGPDKTQSFRSILLNICQEEFEGVATAREVDFLCSGLSWNLGHTDDPCPGLLQTTSSWHKSLQSVCFQL